MTSISTDNAVATLRLLILVMLTTVSCGEELDVNLILPLHSPCYGPQTAGSVLVRVTTADPSRAVKQHSCFAINSVLAPDLLQEAIASRGPLASSLSTEEALVVSVMAFADAGCKTPLICFISSVTNEKTPPMLAKCDKTGWSGCPLPPPQ